MALAGGDQCWVSWMKKKSTKENDVGEYWTGRWRNGQRRSKITKWAKHPVKWGLRACQDGRKCGLWWCWFSRMMGRNKSFMASTYADKGQKVAPIRSDWCRKDNHHQLDQPLLWYQSEWLLSDEMILKLIEKNSYLRYPLYSLVRLHGKQQLMYVFDATREEILSSSCQCGFLCPLGSGLWDSLDEDDGAGLSK